MNAVLWVRDRMRQLQAKGQRSMASHQDGNQICIVYFDPKLGAWKLEQVTCDDDGQVQ